MTSMCIRWLLVALLTVLLVLEVSAQGLLNATTSEVPLTSGATSSQGGVASMPQPSGTTTAPPSDEGFAPIDGSQSGFIPITPPATVAPGPSNETIQVPWNVTHVPVPPPPPSTSTSSGKQSNLLPYSIAGIASIVAIGLVIFVVLYRRNRESEIKNQRDRTLDMSEMFLSASASREQNAQPEMRTPSPTNEDQEIDSLNDSNPHELADSAIYDESNLSSPGAYGSDHSDSYRSSTGSDARHSVPILFDDVPSGSESSIRSSRIYDSERFYASDASIVM